jgi:hypothetical protein
MLNTMRLLSRFSRGKNLLERVVSTRCPRLEYQPLVGITDAGRSNGCVLEELL